MSRYIDADALKKDIAMLHVLNDEAEIRRTYEYNPHVTATDFEETLVSVFDAIDDAPSIGIDLADDGTLVVAVEDATKVTRVLVEDEQKNGCLYYADQPQGEWIDDGFAHRCSECGKQGVGIEYYNYCPQCGAKMKGADDE